MHNPWDIAPIPTIGDEKPDDTYVAKGRAVSVWEEVEVALSGLFAVLSGERRGSIVAQQAYGEHLNFKDRLAHLERVGCSYFINHCNQADEGEFGALCDRARRFSVRRNEITHSWVQNVAFATSHKRLPSGAEEWRTTHRFFLVPPTYTSRKFDPNFRPEFIYTSVEIMRYAEHFHTLKHDVDRFAMILEMPELRSLL
jgi:hypothetical protein